MTTLVVLTVIDIVLLIAGLAIYLFIVGSQLGRVAQGLEEAADLVWAIKKNAEVIEPGVERINRTGTTVVMATHDKALVDRMRRRVIEIEKGQVVRDQARGVYG